METKNPTYLFMSIIGFEKELLNLNKKRHIVSSQRVQSVVEFGIVLVECSFQGIYIKEASLWKARDRGGILVHAMPVFWYSTLV